MTQSQAFAYAQGKIQEQKTDNMINLLDSIIRRNKDDEDMLRIDEEPAAVQTKDVDDVFRRKLDFFYNRHDHQLTKLFYQLVQPDEEEKMGLVTLKIIDNLLRPQIPQICDFFLFTSLKRVLMRTDWLKPASEEVQMSKIHDLKKKFVKKFPLVGRDIEMGQLAHQIGKIDLIYFINKENMVTGDPTEEFNSRKTKIKDDNYKSLYD